MHKVESRFIIVAFSCQILVRNRESNVVTKGARIVGPEPHINEKRSLPVDHRYLQREIVFAAMERLRQRSEIYSNVQSRGICKRDDAKLDRVHRPRIAAEEVGQTGFQEMASCGNRVNDEVLRCNRMCASTDVVAFVWGHMWPNVAVADCDKENRMVYSH